jgi:hypothetical protein
MNGKVLIGDFDGDSVKDCACYRPQNLDFYKGTSAGMVQGTAVTTTSGCIPPQGFLTVVADLDGSGRDDITFVFANPGDAVNPYLAALVAGQADGTFQCSTFPKDLSTFFPSPPVSAVGDFTSDGKLDVVIVGYTVASYTNSNEVQWIVLSAQGASLPLMATYTDAGFVVGATGTVNSISVSDVNGDGHLDIVANVFIRSLSGMGPGTTTVTQYGYGDGTFSPTPP